MRLGRTSQKSSRNRWRTPRSHALGGHAVLPRGALPAKAASQLQAKCMLQSRFIADFSTAVSVSICAQPRIKNLGDDGDEDGGSSSSPQRSQTRSRRRSRTDISLWIACPCRACNRSSCVCACQRRITTWSKMHATSIPASIISPAKIFKGPWKHKKVKIQRTDRNVTEGSEGGRDAIQSWCKIATGEHTGNLDMCQCQHVFRCNVWRSDPVGHIVSSCACLGQCYTFRETEHSTFQIWWWRSCTYWSGQVLWRSNTQAKKFGGSGKLWECQPEAVATAVQ